MKTVAKNTSKGKKKEKSESDIVPSQTVERASVWVPHSLFEVALRAALSVRQRLPDSSGMDRHRRTQVRLRSRTLISTRLIT